MTEIKSRYRELVKIHHPDRGGNEETFRAVQDAYDILTVTPSGHVYRNVDITLRDAFWGCEVSIPVGDEVRVIPIDEGTESCTLRYHDYGYGKGSDLYLDIRVLEDDTWIRHEGNLTTILPVNSLLAIVGGNMTVDRFGENITVYIPAGAQHGQIIVVKGGGMRGQGDAIFHLQIVTPSVTEEHSEMINNILAEYC